MGFGKMWISKPYRIIFTVAILCMLPSITYAGAWTQGAGKGLFIQNISYYSTDQYFNNSGNKQTLNNYSKYELNQYLEYGLRDWLTVGANIFVERASQNNIAGINQTNWGIGDSEFLSAAECGKRMLLYSPSNLWLNFQALIKNQTSRKSAIKTMMRG